MSRIKATRGNNKIYLKVNEEAKTLLSSGALPLVVMFEGNIPTPIESYEALDWALSSGQDILTEVGYLKDVEYLKPI